MRLLSLRVNGEKWQQQATHRVQGGGGEEGRLPIEMFGRETCKEKENKEIKKGVGGYVLMEERG